MYWGVSKRVEAGVCVALSPGQLGHSPPDADRYIDFALYFHGSFTRLVMSN